MLQTALKKVQQEQRLKYQLRNTHLLPIFLQKIISYTSSIAGEINRYVVSDDDAYSVHIDSCISSKGIKINVLINKRTL